MESYGLVSSRTAELECIHSTSITLHQLKQFVHAKHQLDNYLKNSDETGAQFDQQKQAFCFIFM